MPFPPARKPLAFLAFVVIAVVVSRGLKEKGEKSGDAKNAPPVRSAYAGPSPVTPVLGIRG